MTIEQGKPLVESRAEVTYAAAFGLFDFGETSRLTDSERLAMRLGTPASRPRLTSTRTWSTHRIARQLKRSKSGCLARWTVLD
jgi:hypothetical protein